MRHVLNFGINHKLVACKDVGRTSKIYIHRVNYSQPFREKQPS